MTNILARIADTKRSALERRLEETRYFVGIDLGTTNSTLAFVDTQALLEGDLAGAVRVLTVRQEMESGAIFSPLVPSAVAQVDRDLWWVGQGAKDLRRRGLLRGRQIFYSCKSEMGLGREPFYPFAASPDLDAPYKVAGRVLKTLAEAAIEDLGPNAVEKAVVTVPASFQLAARRDTFRAAKLGGIDLAERALLDEPNAAFLDFVLTGTGGVAGEQMLDFSALRTVLVFDFGGGTCDVSILRVRVDSGSGRLELANLAVARYEQLGGDNIDIAIVEDVLLPRFLEQNGLDGLDLSFSDKKNRLLPQLLGVAEALKLGVCAEYAAQLGLKKDSAIDRSLAAVQPSVQVDLPARQGEPIRSLILERPTLTLSQLDAVLEPFLDVDLLHPRDTELNVVRSIFGPVEDALARAGLSPTDIDGVLLVGGSSLIPQVQQALAGRFEDATALRFPDNDRTLVAVARGAALHAFFLHGLGMPLLKPIAQESIGVLTSDGGFAELIARGTELPQPADGSFATFSGLAVPRDLMREVQIVVAAESPEKVLGVEVLTIDEIKSAGEPISLRWRIDANKLLEVQANLTNFPDRRCEVTLENPLSATKYRNDRHRRILELEEKIVRAQAARRPLAELSSAMDELAGLQYEEHRYEKAIEWARHGMKADDRPSLYLLNLVALCYDGLGAPDRAEKHYREAMRVAPGSAAPRFNLSLLLERQGHFDEALKQVDEALRLAPTEGAYHVQRGLLLRKLGRESDSRKALQVGAEGLDRTVPFSPFHRSWRMTAARALGDEATARKLQLQAGLHEGTVPTYDASKLPAQNAAITRKTS
jgi:molecular chaperone DnaK (HSP70)